MKINNIILLVFCFVFSNCGKDFLDKKPLSSLSTANFYKNADEARAGILAAYSTLQGPRFYGKSYYVYLEGASDDATTKLDEKNEPFNAFNWTPITGSPGYREIDDLWDQIYEGIYRSNLILSKLEPISMDATQKKYIEGEGKFLRGLYYWHLAVLFEKGPVVLKPAEKIEDVLVPMSSQLEIFQQAERDLLEAIPNLPTAWPASETGRATVWAAKAMLGKTYLYWACHQKDNSKFALAAKQFKDVINSGAFTLLPNLDDAFRLDNENNRESVFEIQYADRGPLSNDYYSDGGNAGEANQRDLIMGIQNQGGQEGYMEVIATKDWVNSMEAGDPRTRATVYFPWDKSLKKGVKTTAGLKDDTAVYFPSYGRSVKAIGNFDGAYYHIKKDVNAFTGSSGVVHSPNNWIMIRYSDVLLMAAEAINESEGNTDEAIGYLNKVRERARLGRDYLALNDVTLPNSTLPGHTKFGYETVTGMPLPPFPHTRVSTNDQIEFGNTKPDLQYAIVLERRSELAFEYHRYLDIVRWERYDPGHPGAASAVFRNKSNSEDIKPFVANKHWRLPIPQYEIDVSRGSLVQHVEYR